MTLRFRARSVYRVVFIHRTRYERYFKQDITILLQRINKDIQCKGRINWKVMMDIFKKLKVTRRTVNHCIKFCIEMCRLFQKYKCRESFFVVKVMDFMNEVVDTTCTGNYYHARQVLFRAKERILDIYLHVEPEKGVFIDPVTAFYRRFTTLFYRNHVWQAVATANLALLKLYTKFGAVMKVYSVKEIDAKAYAHKLRKQLDLVGIDRDVEYIVERVINEMRIASNRRLYMVIDTIIIMWRISEFPRYADDYACCYRLMFDTTSAPLVSVEEMKNSVRRLLPDLSEDMISRIAQNPQQILPQYSNPRSLQHLSRCQVRENLRMKRTLPYGVKQLNCSPLQREYILLDDDGIYNKILDYHADYSTIGIELPRSEINLPEDKGIINFLKTL